MRIKDRLPEYLWPKPTKATGYILNRMPTKKLDWKTPIEMLYSLLGLPNPTLELSHLMIYACRVYPLIPKDTIPREQKLAPRAHIGYLVGYDSMNIYRIWMPSKKKIIRTRDVTFNKKLFYNPKEPDLAQILQLDVEQIVEVVDISSTDLNLLAENLDLDSDLDEDSDSENEITNADFADTPDTVGRSTIPTPDSSNSYTPMLPTPEETPEPEPETEHDIDNRSASQLQTELSTGSSNEL